jgi:hypothetical protein
MDGADWFGVVTGGLGAVTGIAGFILGYVAYRRSEELKALDLRLELRNGEADLRGTVEELPALLRHARASRAEVLGAMGLSDSGALQSFVAAWEEDLKTAGAMVVSLPKEANDYQGVGHRDLETGLVEVHVQQRRAGALRDKYQEHLARDEKQAQEFRAYQRSKAHRLLGH